MKMFSSKECKFITERMKVEKQYADDEIEAEIIDSILSKKDTKIYNIKVIDSEGNQIAFFNGIIDICVKDIINGFNNDYEFWIWSYDKCYSIFYKPGDTTDELEKILG